MLKYQAQGTDECFPTTIGIILDIPKDRIINLAKDILKTNKDWPDFSTQQMITVYPKLLDELNAPAWLRKIRPCVRSNARMISKADFEDSLISIGVLQIMNPFIAAAHIMPFDNGKYLDPTTTVLDRVQVARIWGSRGFYPIGIHCDPDSFPMLCS